jgi:hypothetical protein
VYVAEYNNTIRKITPAGVVSTLAGAAGQVPANGTPGDGTGSAARFYEPSAVATDATGNVYVADTNNDTIRKITPDGVVSTLAGTAGHSGSADSGIDPTTGQQIPAQFKLPRGIATDSAGNLYVADTGNDTIRKITISQNGGATVATVSTVAGTAGQVPANGTLGNGTGSAARFNNPQAVGTDLMGNVYVADTSNQTIRKITPDGVVSTLAGMPGIPGFADSTGPNGQPLTPQFNEPTGIAIDSGGNVYVADSSNHTVRKISPDSAVTTIVGAPGSTGDVLGPLPGSLNAPAALALLPGAGVRLVVADENEDTILEIALP